MHSRKRRSRSLRSPSSPRLIFGLVLIIIGGVYTAELLMEDFEAGEFLHDAWHLWPALLIIAGVSKIFWPGSSTGRGTGALLAVIGVWLLGEERGWFEASFWDYWPLLLVLLGLRIAWQGVRGRRTAAKDSASTVNAVAMLGGASRTNNSADFRGGDMVAFMGGCEVDLRRARIAENPAVIDAFAMWGGVEIRVPEEWSVTMKGVPLLGGYEDNTHPPPEDEIPEEDRQELVVKGFAIMGGVEVKN